jgi:hypothetical protein
MSDSDYTDLIAAYDDLGEVVTSLTAELAARDAACGHLPNELVARALWSLPRPELDTLTLDELHTIHAATFQVTE